MNDEERELLDEILAEDDVEQSSLGSFFNKYIVPVISIFLLLLLTSYFIFGPAHSTIRGQIASADLIDNEYGFGEYLLVFYNDTASELESIYTLYQEEKLVETSVCLKGEVYNTTYGITEIFYPKIIDATYTSVTFEPCPQDTIVMLHTHPYKSCLGSDLDLETFAKHKARSPDLLMLVMCEQRRYTLYN